MYLCYVDESGTSDLPGNTSHYVLAGVSIPIENWKSCDQEIEALKVKYSLQGQEAHVAWLLRPYLEQSRIASFASLDHATRRTRVDSLRKAELLRLQAPGKRDLYKQTRKNFRETEPYIHLAFDERRQFASELAQAISKWTFARLFAECVDKVHFALSVTKKTVEEQAFEQVVSRFETFLNLISKGAASQFHGLLIHDKTPRSRRSTPIR